MKPFDPSGPESLKKFKLREQEAYGVRKMIHVCDCIIAHPVGEGRYLWQRCRRPTVCTRPDDWETVEWQ